MLDEFDDPAVPVHPPAATGWNRDPVTRHRLAAARLVSRVYRSAGDRLRAEMLTWLLRPLGTLGLVAAASGAFARLLQHGSAAPEAVPLEDVARFSSDQIRELAQFVHEVDPEAILQIGRMLTDNPVGVGALSASALVLLYRRLRAQSSPSPIPTAGSDGMADTPPAAPTD
jgi:hypothetical protein